MDDVVAHLQAELSVLSTTDVLAWMSMAWLRAATDPLYLTRQLGFQSQQRQSAYMISVLLSTAEPEEPIELNDELKRYLVRILNEVEIRYADPYLHGPVPESMREHAVAFGAFTQFFMSGRLSYVPQIIDRLENIDSAFDDALRDSLGVSVGAVIGIVAFILESMQSRWDAAISAYERVDNSRREMLNAVEHGGASIAEEIGRRQNDVDLQNALGVIQEYYPMSFKASELRASFEEADSFLQAFSLRRGDVSFPVYYAESEGSPAENAPFFWVDDDTLCCPFRAVIYEAIEERIARAISRSKDGSRFSRARARFLEEKSVALIASLFPDDALRLGSYYETSDSQFEHDGLVFWDGRLVLIEAKSSNLREPSRTPDRAFMRVQQQFKSERGIQHAYDQAQRIIDLIEDAGDLVLYDRDGAEVARINRSAISEVHVVCTTMESFGPIATNLTYLLERRANRKYPLAFNLFDLETLVTGFKKSGVGSNGFLRYLNQRENTMGLITADDELEFAGTYIKHGTLPVPADAPILLVSGSEIFDDFYFEEMGTERAGHTSLSEMAIRHLARLAKRNAELATYRRLSPKIGRNDLCPCGSGKKYKKCHGG